MNGNRRFLIILINSNTILKILEEDQYKRVIDLSSYVTYFLGLQFRI